MNIADACDRRHDVAWAEYVEKAVALIEERGWHQGDYEDPRTGAVCAEAALMIAVTGRIGTDYGDGTLLDLERALRSRLGLAGTGLPHWNDKMCTRADEVTGKLRTFAAELHARAER